MEAVDLWGNSLSNDEKTEFAKMLTQVNWTLPGMEVFSDREKEILIRSIQLGDIVNSIHSLGWALWPTKNRGYYDSEHLRMLAAFLEIQNKPFWDEYDNWCNEHPPEQEGDELCLDGLGFIVIPTSTTETSASSSESQE